MDSCNKGNNSPGGSNTDSLIEKFRFEITKKSDEDLLNIKKLTIQASNKSRESSVSNRDIDKKISDLECLIMRLQEELNDLSCASKQMNDCKQEDECEVDYCCPVVNECEEPTKEPCPEEPETCPQDDIEYDSCITEEVTPCSKTDESKLEKENVTKSSNHRYPIILRDVGHTQEDVNEDLNIFNETILINNEQSTTDGEKEDIPNIRQTMFYDWKDSEKKDELKEEATPDNDTESISNMIAELRAEMDETIHTLNDGN